MLMEMVSSLTECYVFEIPPKLGTFNQTFKTNLECDFSQGGSIQLHNTYDYV
jgi:hypothetical protein